MPLPTILSGNVASALGGAYEVANSCRFNDGDSAYMSKSQSDGNEDVWTLSMWIKRGQLGTSYIPLFQCPVDGSNGTYATFYNTDQLEWVSYTSNSVKGALKTNRVFRDPSAWYHLVFRYESTNGTAGNRMRLYVNGVEETSFATDTNPSSGDDMWVNSTSANFYLGYDNASILGGSATYFDGYMAEVCLIDGSALAPTSFGEFDDDSPTIWKPIDVSGLTFGTNGFYLDFEASGNLGNDANGGTDLSESNLAAADQATDTPTNSFCTMNPLDNEFVDATFSEGNNQLVIASGTKAHATSTMGVSAGKWYWEIECDASDGDDQSVAVVDRVSKDGSTDTYSSSYPYNYVYQSQGRYVNNNSVTDTDPNSFTSGDIIGVALDLTNNKLYFAKNNTWQDSGDPTSGSTGTGAMSITAASSTANGFYFPAVGSETTSRGATWKCNFGGCSAFTVSSAANDANGYGNFEYAPPSGYLALCTKNLGSDGG